MTRPRNAKLDELLGVKQAVLDDGFIYVVDYMGTDQTVVRAARVSYGAGTKTVREDRGLIRYLMRHRHTTPFEMCEITFHVRVPMDCWRQWIRHRTASVNEYSTRYSEAIDSQQKTARAGWRRQDKSNKQGSRHTLNRYTEGLVLSIAEAKLHAYSRKVYEKTAQDGSGAGTSSKGLTIKHIH